MARSENLRDLLTGLLMLALQVILFRHLQIYGAESDLVLIWLIWLCTRKSRTEVLLFAALFGFLQDALTDMWGLHMFSKTFLVFIVYHYLNRISENRLMIWQIFLILLSIVFLHNLILIGLSRFVELYSNPYLYGSMLVAGSIYTAVIGSFLYLVRTG